MNKTAWTIIIVIAIAAGGWWYVSHNEEISAGDAMEDSMKDALMHDSASTTDTMMHDEATTSDTIMGNDAGMIDNGVMMSDATSSDAMMAH